MQHFERPYLKIALIDVMALFAWAGSYGFSVSDEQKAVIFLSPFRTVLSAIDRFPNYCLGARRGKDLVAKGCYGPWRILLNVNPPRFPVCYSV